MSDEDKVKMKDQAIAKKRGKARPAPRMSRENLLKFVGDAKR